MLCVIYPQRNSAVTLCVISVRQIAMLCCAWYYLRQIASNIHSVIYYAKHPLPSCAWCLRAKIAPLILCVNITTPNSDRVLVRNIHTVIATAIFYRVIYYVRYTHTYNGLRGKKILCEFVYRYAKHFWPPATIITYDIYSGIFLNWLHVWFPIGESLALV